MKIKINTEKLVMATYIQIKKLNIDEVALIKDISLSRQPNSNLWSGICEELREEFSFNLILNIKTRWVRNTEGFYTKVSMLLFLLGL